VPKGSTYLRRGSRVQLLEELVAEEREGGGVGEVGNMATLAAYGRSTDILPRTVTPLLTAFAQ